MNQQITSIQMLKMTEWLRNHDIQQFSLDQESGRLNVFENVIIERWMNPAMGACHSKSKKTLNDKNFDLMFNNIKGDFFIRGQDLTNCDHFPIGTVSGTLNISYNMITSLNLPGFVNTSLWAIGNPISSIENFPYVLQNCHISFIFDDARMLNIIGEKVKPRIFSNRKIFIHNMSGTVTHEISGSRSRTNPV